MNLSLSPCGRSETRSTLPNIRWLTSASMWLGISAGKHSISTSRSICSRMPPSCFTPAASPLSTIGHAHLQHLVHGDALQVDVQQRALDGLVLPVHDHHLGGSPPSRRDRKSCCDRSPNSECASTAADRRSRAANPCPRHTPRRNLSARAPGAHRSCPALRGLASNTFFAVAVAINSFLYKNNLLTEVSS
jgi:hypothetical protein